MASARVSSVGGSALVLVFAAVAHRLVHSSFDLASGHRVLSGDLAVGWGVVDGAVAKHDRSCSVKLVGARILVDRVNEVTLVLRIQNVRILHVLWSVHRQLHLILVLDLYSSH